MEHNVSWAVLGLAALMIGVSKTGFPGAGILAIPLVAMATPVLLPDHPDPTKASTGLVLPMLIVGDIFAVAFYRRHAVWKHLVKLIPFAAIGIVLGARFMKMVSDRQIKLIIGLVVLAILGLSYWRQQVLRLAEAKVRPAGSSEMELPSSPVAHGPLVRFVLAWWFPVCIGLTAGVTTMMANAAGPIMLIYLLAMRLPKNEFIGTGAWYFLLLNCFKVPFSGEQHLITLASAKVNLMMVPIIVAGALLGVRLLKRIPEKGFTAIVQLLAAIGAAWLAVSALIPKGTPLK